MQAMGGHNPAKMQSGNGKENKMKNHISKETKEKLNKLFDDAIEKASENEFSWGYFCGISEVFDLLSEEFPIEDEEGE